MSWDADTIAVTEYDGAPAESLAARWGVPAVHAFSAVGSTLDVAHRLAPSSPSGTLVLADEQTAGRGRHGRRWSSAPGAGVWLTLVERPAELLALDVLALRCGLFASECLEELAGGAIGVKWPNDLYVSGCKLAGILIETRWRGQSPDWVAIGFGLNVRAPEVGTATGLAHGATRLNALDRLVPALRRAAAASGHLSDDELSRWRARDITLGREITEPASGTVQGITAAGDLIVAGADGSTSMHRSGSLTFVTPLSCS